MQNERTESRLAIAQPLSPDAQRVLASIALGVFEHDRVIQGARTALADLPDDTLNAISDLLDATIVTWCAIAKPAVRQAEALSEMMPGFGSMTLEKWADETGPSNRLELIRRLFETCGLADRLRAPEDLS
jgi:hypothetical protein